MVGRKQVTRALDSSINCLGLRGWAKEGYTIQDTRITYDGSLSHQRISLTSSRRMETETNELQE